MITVDMWRADPVPHEPGRWCVRRRWWQPWGPGPLQRAWIASGPNADGDTSTVVFGDGLDAARQARRFADIAARRGVTAAGRAFGWTS